MSTQTIWLEGFTGISLAEGSPDPNDKDAVAKAEKRVKDLADQRMAIEAQEQAYEKKRQKQALVLAQVRAELVPIKEQSRKILSTKITGGPLKGKSFLAVEGEQIDEIDPDVLRTMGGKKLTIDELLPGVGDGLGLVISQFDRLGRKLSDTMYEEGGKSEPLFSSPQVQAEYWAPLRLERIYPDGLVLDKFSETQQMLDATNQLYLDMCEQKKLAGQLTPEIDLVSELLGAGKDIAGLGGDVLGALGGVVNAEGMKLAKDILSGMSEAFSATDTIYKQVKESDYAGASSSAIDLAGKLTGALLSQVGVPKGTVDAVTAGFGVGSAAVLMGKAMAQYRSGEGSLEDALGVMGDLVGKSLTLAADQTVGGASDGLRVAAKAAPSALRAAGLASGPLAKAVREGDFPGVVKTLGAITTEVLGNLPGIDVKMVEDVEQIATAGTIMIYKMAVNAKRGDLMGAFNTAINDISENLESILSLAGVPDDISSKVVGAYQGSASASKAVQMLIKDPGNVTAAMAELTIGLDKALSGTGDPVLKEIGGGIKTAVEKMVSAQAVAELYKAGDFEGALTKLTEELGSGIESIIAVAVPQSGDEEEDQEEGEEEDADDEEGDVSGEDGEERQQRQLKKKERTAASKSLAEMVAQLKAGGPKPDAATLEKAVKSMEADLKAEREAADTEEAQLLLAQAELDLKSLSEAEKTGAEASNIDNLIADLLRDRMILKIATQIAQGGASFLAQFVPALGAVSAGVKLAAQLVAVAQRAKQLDAWIKSQKDLAAAQSALSSSASNFVKNQGQQLAHYSAQAFFAAAQLAGEITKLADPSGIGAAVSGIAAAGAKAEQMLMERKDKIDIERAWKVTQKSLRNPKNRQLGLEARKLNPSLAKFSIAWGAVVLKDPLARNAMQACGLTESSLKNDSADVNKVVQYLELFYEDDKSLYRDSKEPVPEWVPKEIEVSLKSWSQLCLAATNLPKLKIENAALLEGLLGQLMSAEDVCDKTADGVEKAKELFMSQRKEMEDAMKKAGVQDPVLEPPPIAEIELAIDAHQVSVTTLFSLLTQLADAYAACRAQPITPSGQPDPNVNELQAALKQLAGEAKTRAQVAQAEAQGVETTKLDLKGTVEALRRKAAAKATPKKETEAVQ